MIMMIKVCLIPFLVAVSLHFHVGIAFVLQPSNGAAPSRGGGVVATLLRAEASTSSSSTSNSAASAAAEGAATETDDAILSLPMFIDERVELEKRPASAVTPEDMIVIAKRFLASSGGLGGDPSMLSSSFTFEGPVVGPLGKTEFVTAIGSVDFASAFPDFVSEFYGFHVDPFEGDRVWYTARGRGTNTGPLVPFVPEPSGTGRNVINPPQVCSLTIDHRTRLITKYTIGYVVDRTVGNTGGLGGLYGILYALGRPLPFPEAQPWKKSFQYDVFQKLGGLLQKLQ